ncbi:MAG TPA: helix-turn-helix transcriptional regulator [Bdellovibrionota bacterium]|nr:helix-turn-helix transcriptional regulator [Bdellovibrionota bacterium]
MTSLRDTEKLVQGLKVALQMRGVTYRDLTRPLGLSEASVKRLLSDRGRALSLDRLAEICDFARISLHEVLDLGGATPTADHHPLTLAQEEGLARSPRLLAFYVLLNEGLTLDRICATRKITQDEARRALLTLGRLGLVEPTPSGEPRLIYPPPIRFRHGGPVEKALAQALIPSKPPSHPGSVLEARYVACSPHTARTYRARMRELLADWLKDAEADRLRAAQELAAGRPSELRWNSAVLASGEERPPSLEDALPPC